MKTRDTFKTSRFVIGNWKCTKSIDGAHSWIDGFRSGYRPMEGVEVVIAPPMVLLAQLAEYCAQTDLNRLSLAAQDVSPFPPGSYTGATAADMLKGLCR